jgi:hypothetical protein
MMTAIKFGEHYGPRRREALKARRALGEDATQADWWRVCPRGDWLVWQLERVEQAADNPALERAMERIRSRAIRRALRGLRGVRGEWATAWRNWARRWLSGEDRTSHSALSAWCVARNAAWAAGSAAWATGSARAAWAAAPAARVAARAARAAAGVARDAWEAGSYAGAVSRAAVSAAAIAAGADAAIPVAELRLQAREIRNEIPEWDPKWEVA